MRESSKQVLAIIAITILLVGSLFVYLKMISPAYGRLSEEEIKRQEKETQIKLLNQYKAKFDNLISRYENLGSNLQTINLALPIKSDPATILATLDAMAKKNGLTIGTLTFKEIEPSSQEKTATSTLNLPPHTLQVTFDLLGSYESFKNFIKDLESEIRLMDISDLKFQPVAVATKTKSPINYFQFNLTINTYYQPIK